MMELIIGRPEGERVLVRVLDRLYPDAENPPGVIWLQGEIEIWVGGWRGKYSVDLRDIDFIYFREQLETLYATLRGEARFEPVEPWIELTMKADTVGHIRVEGVADDCAGAGNKLHFTLPDLDQTYLPSMLDQLRAIERTLSPHVDSGGQSEKG